MSAGYPMPDNMHYPDDEEYGVTKKHNPDLTDAAWDKRWKGADEVKRKAREEERKRLVGTENPRKLAEKDDSIIRLDSRNPIKKRGRDEEEEPSDEEPINPKRNKEQERRRKRAQEYLQPSIKKPQIYPLINGQVRSTEAGELSLLPRNHNLETDTAEPEKGDSSKKVPYDGSGKGFLKVHAHGRRTPKEVAEQIELRRRAPGANADCGLSLSEYKTMMTQPKDPSRARRWHHARQKDLEEAYGLRFPACFFAMYEFAVTVDPMDPLNCMTRIGLQLTGAFATFHKMCQNKTFIPPAEHKIYRNLVHRHYWDPPEFQVLCVNLKDKSHLGYWRDAPEELPPFICMNDGKEGRLYAVGPNLLAAVKLWLYRRVGSQTLHTRKCFATISDISLNWNIIIERVTYELRERETRCNARTLNTVGISVPISVDSKGNEVGYRPMDLTDAELRKVLDGIDEAPDDQMRLKRFKKLQEIFQLIQLANDECDFGMGLEFGISLFAHGSHYFHKMILKTLPMAYQLLKRDLYGDILKAHLADRRKTLCDRLDIEPESNSGIGPQIGTYRIIEAPKEELTRPSFSRPVKTEAQRDPKAGPSYLEKLKHKSSLGSTDNSAKGGASDWS